MSRVNRLSILLFTVVCLDSPSTFAQFHVARLQYLSRSGAQIGETFDMSVHGEHLDEVSELRFSSPAITATVKTLDPLPLADNRQTQFSHFTVQVPEDIPPGRYEVRAVGRHGTTNPRAFLVSHLGNQVLTQVSHDRSASIALPRNELLQAACVAKSVDWFSFDIGDGQRLHIELFAQRLDSALIGQLELFDPNGRKIQSARGSDDMDPELTIESLPAGSYKLAVRDFMYRGGPDFHYQLLIRDADSAPGLMETFADDSGLLPKHWLTRAATVMGLDRLTPPAAVDIESVEAVEPPVELTVWFPQGQTDHRYQFNAVKGQQLAMDIVSQRFAEPTDPRLILDRIEPQAGGKPKLHHVLHVDDSPNVNDGIISLVSKDPVALFTVPEDALYRLSIRDLDIGTSLRPRQKYCLRIRQPNPGFDLVAYRVFPAKDAIAVKPFASKLFRGGVEMIRVFALRRDGWTGAIKVTVAGLPDGVTCAEAYIAKNQDKTHLTLVASEQASGQADSLQVLGHSIDGKISREAEYVTIARARGHGRGALQNRITTTLPVHVSQHDLSPLSLTLGDGNVAEVKKGAAISLPIRMVRREGGKTPCVFRPVFLPPGIAAGEVTIAADATEGKIELKQNGDTKPGTYSIWLQAETKIKVRPNPQLLERAQAYRANLQTRHDDPAQAANLESIKAAIIEADKRVEAAKGQANEQELTIFIPTNHATIRVVQP